MAKKKSTGRGKAKKPRDMASRKSVKGGFIARRLGIRGPLGVTQT
jgi:hypothetical protein